MLRRTGYLELRSKALQWTRLGYKEVKKEINIFQTKGRYQQFNDWKNIINPRSRIMIQLRVANKIYTHDTMKKGKIHERKGSTVGDQWYQIVQYPV